MPIPARPGGVAAATIVSAEAIGECSEREDARQA
jgi:hypothetical protein